MIYSIREKFSILADGFPQEARYLRDGGMSEKELNEYFNRSFTVFLKRLEAFQHMKEEVPPEEEKQLRFMLEALLAAKHILNEKH
jgi:hypothetical protein